MKKFAIAFCLLFALSFSASASDPKLMPVEDVRIGMKGYGMSVFQGSKPERFEFEVLGLVNGLANPKQNVIIARLSGPLVDRTGVFAGMSGSPVYIDGKLVGAVAYAFPFSKEAIAGIQPIQNMISVVEKGSDQEPRTSTPLSFNTLMTMASAGGAAATTGSVMGARAVSSGANFGGQAIVPIATPVTFSGVSQSVLDQFADDLKKLGIQAIAGLGGSSSPSSSMAAMVPFDDNTLAPGSSVNVQLARGDFSFDAAGTVTYRDGDRIYAFGHPFLASGATSWPMAESSVITVVPNLNNSFKLTSSGNLVGSINQDRSTTVFGRLGEQPRMIPVRLNIRTSRNKTETYNYELINDPLLTPILMRIAMVSAIQATERQMGQQTIKVNGRIGVKGQPDILIDNAFSTGNGAAVFAVLGVEKPLSALLNSGFDGIDVNAIEVNVTSLDSRSSGNLSRLWIDKTEVARGEKLEIQAFARKDNGSEFVERIAFEIPADAPLGQIVILVGDGSSINQADARGQGGDFTPKNLAQLVGAINKLKKNNRLYLKVLIPSTGAVVHTQEMPSLPPSVLATLNSERTSGGFSPLGIAVLAERELPPSDFLISGQQAITINIVK